MAASSSREKGERRKGIPFFATILLKFHLIAC
jgi:hypothetical protein